MAHLDFCAWVQSTACVHGMDSNISSGYNFVNSILKTSRIVEHSKFNLHSTHTLSEPPHTGEVNLFFLSALLQWLTCVNRAFLIVHVLPVSHKNVKVQRLQRVLRSL